MTGALRARLARLRAGYLDRPFASAQLLLLAGVALLVLGVLMSVSTSISASLHDGNRGTLWTQISNEILFIGVGLPIFWLGCRLSPRAYRALAYPALLLATMLMVAVFVPGVGVVLNGAHRWLRVGPVQIQPSEFAKLAMLLWGADLLARKQERNTLTSTRRVLLPLVPGFAAMCALVMAEPDLGTTLCFLTILVGLLWTVGLPVRYFTGMLVVVTTAVVALAWASPYRRERLVSFLHPGQDASNTGHQALQGLYALSTGGPFGVGLGSGTSKYGWVPNASTDYVFAIIGEELGLLGCVVVLVAFGVFAYAALRVARRCDDHFIRLAASGTAVWICGQALINVGYVTGLLPVTGIPLPLVSAGGTSLVLTIGVLGMLVSFARYEPAAMSAAAARAELHPPGHLRRMVIGVAKPRPARRARAPKARPVRSAQPSRNDEPVPAQPARGPQPVTAQPVPAQRVRAARPVRAAARSVPAAGQPVRAAARSVPAAGQPVRDQPVGTAQAPRRQQPRPQPTLRPTGSDSYSARPR